LIAKLKANYKLLGTAVADFKKKKGEPKPFIGNELISNETELALVEQYLDLEDQEQRTFKRLNVVLETIPVFTQYLTTIKGIGPAMAGVIISEIDIHRARHSSCIWKYAGLDVAPDGAGRSKRTEHLIRVKYLTKDKEEKERDSITFNPWLKSKLIGVLATSFLRMNNETYRKIYDDYKHRLENHARYGIANEAALKVEMAEKGFTKYSAKKHRHNMSLRYMIKIFLIELYTNWRTLEGLPVSLPYAEAKLGRKHAA